MQKRISRWKGEASPHHHRRRNLPSSKHNQPFVFLFETSTKQLPRRNVRTTRGSQPFKTLLYTTLCWSTSGYKSEYLFGAYNWQQTCLCVQTADEFWLLGQRYTIRSGLFGVPLRLFLSFTCRCDQTAGGSSIMEIYKCASRPAL